MHVSIFCFSLPVLNAVAFFDDCFFFSQQPKQKRRVLRGELDLAVLPSFAQSKRKKRGLISWWWCLRVGVCLRFACVSMCVGWLWFCLGGRGVRLSIVFTPAGAWIVCVCFCLKRALSFGSLTLSRSRWPSNLLWSPPQFDYFYQKVLSLLCLFCFL